ncbi:MAG: hypothetical protein JXR40_09135 [Pontiellaceae bacterium]|nr:hypothetical protein [Pontiellaceae bacterium]
MNVFKKIIYLLVAVSGLLICGCADLSYDDGGYSDVPWARPQEWEGSGSFPGMPSGY